MIRAHLGIRFAAPPVGRRRWCPPEDVRDEAPLGTWPMDCPQPPSGSASRAPGQSEDCLFLNIWAPDDADGLPVLVWFYGGSFLFGSTSSPTTDGAALASRGCVVVSAAYRVGLFGYLAHRAGTDGAAGADHADHAADAPTMPVWPPYAAVDDAYLEFGEPCRVGTGWRADHLNFLERYFG